jgi:hypothetical protein
MSPTRKRISSESNYVAAEPRGITAAEMQQWWSLYQTISESKPLQVWIIAAGIGAILEGLHIGWLAARYIFKF